jgi:hypothetical protein
MTRDTRLTRRKVARFLFWIVLLGVGPGRNWDLPQLQAELSKLPILHLHDPTAASPAAMTRDTRLTRRKVARFLSDRASRRRAMPQLAFAFWEAKFSCKPN